MLVGYKKVLEDDKSLRKQTRALKEAGCKEIVRLNGIGKDRSIIDLGSLKKGDTVVVWRLDSLANSIKELVEIVREIRARKLNLKSLSEPFAIAAKNGADVVQILESVSNFQSSLIKHRTLHGLREAKAEGRIGGRPRKLGKAQVNKARAMLKKPNMTKSRVAAEFGVCRVTLNKALES